MRQHEAVSERRTPAHEFAGGRIFPEAGDEGAHQQLLGERHARVGRHFETAEFHKAKATGGPVRRKQLVDADFRAVGIARHIRQKIAEQPVDQPRQRRHAFSGGRHLRKRDLQLVETVVAGLVDTRRLARRADEEA